MKPDLVITEKGVSDLAQHFLVKAGISVIRRVRKTDNNRIARFVTEVFPVLKCRHKCIIISMRTFSAAYFQIHVRHYYMVLNGCISVLISLDTVVCCILYECLWSVSVALFAVPASSLFTERAAQQSPVELTS